MARQEVARGVDAAPRTVEAAPDRSESRNLAHEFRGTKIVWQREMIRFWQDRSRIVVSLLQPVLFLFVLGTGLSSLIASRAGVSLRTFLFPGVLAMSTMFTAMFSAASLVWDREFGFLREMLVAPVSRASILIGKALGGATVATIPGFGILALAGAVGVPYDPVLFAELAGELFLLSFVITTVGLVLAVRIKQIQSFMALTQLLLMPMLFLSGALFPISGLPTWLHLLTRINPLTYAIDPIRRGVFARLDAPLMVVHRLSPGVTWGSWTIPVGLELLLVFVIGIGLLGVAILEFRGGE